MHKPATTPRDTQIRLIQVNFTYGPNAYLPYSVGLLQAAVQQEPDLAPYVNFEPLQFIRESIQESAERARGVDIVGLSAYIWNWQYVKALAARIKEISPSSFILVGGPQVPHTSESLFQEHPYFDCVAVGEGEETFVELVRAFVHAEEPLGGLHDVKGLVLQGPDGQRLPTGDRPRLTDMNSLNSAYLSGVFDSLVREYPNLHFQASQETHRGCPYSCTFCDWGSATMQKVRRFDASRISEEYRWMAENRIEVLYNCDANYGLFPDDEALTDSLVETKRRFGYPQKFRAAYAKNSNERVYRIAKELNDAGMSKGVTLSLQSLDSETLDAIKRRNMRINNFQELVDMYDASGIPTYTELIAGLPNETLGSFTSGIATLFEAGQHDGLNIYPTMVLPNAQLNDPNYREEHGIQTVSTPMLLSHGSREDNEPQETYEIVIATRTMTARDFEDMMVFSWVVQALHCMNLTQYVSRVLHHWRSVKFDHFYQTLITNPSFSRTFEHELQTLRRVVRDVVTGEGSLDLRDDRFGLVVWPVEEILFLRLAAENFMADLEELLVKSYDIDQKSAESLVAFQIYSLRDWSNNFDDVKTLDCTSDWLAVAKGDLEGLKRSTRYAREEPRRFTSVPEYAREIVWYGRKGSSMRLPIWNVEVT